MEPALSENRLPLSGIGAFYEAGTGDLPEGFASDQEQRTMLRACGTRAADPRAGGAKKDRAWTQTTNSMVGASAPLLEPDGMMGSSLAGRCFISQQVGQVVRELSPSRSTSA